MAAERFRLNRHVKLLWLLPTAGIVAFLLFAGIMAFLLAPTSDFLGITSRNYFYVLPLLALIFGIIDYSWIELIYRNFTYELDDNEIVIRQGVLTRRTTVIPYAAIQDISVERSVAERFLGIATLEIETSGSLRLASEITLPGIAEKDAVVRDLMHRAEKAKSVQAASAAEGESETERLLGGILAELKEISAGLAGLNARGKNGNRKNGNEKNNNKKAKSAFDQYESFKGE